MSLAKRVARLIAARTRSPRKARKLRVTGRVSRAGVCAVRRPGAQWAVQLSLEAWRPEGGTHQPAPLHIEWEAGTAELSQLQQQLPPGALAHAEVCLRPERPTHARLVRLRRPA